MSAPELYVGQTGRIGQTDWRIRKGSKAEGDMVLEMRCAHWDRVKQALTLLGADFHYQVEDILFPRTNGNAGGEYWLSAVSQACRGIGWAAVAARIELEREGGRWPTFERLEPIPPYTGREDAGRFIGNFRTSIAHAMWSKQGADPQVILNLVADVVQRYREALA